MKKLIVSTAILLSALFLCSCESNAVGEDGVIEINEKMFIASCEDIYLNPQNYEGKTIRIQGKYRRDYDESTRNPIYSVYRNAPGCCGDDGVVGFIFFYDESMYSWEGNPSNDDWVEVVGYPEVSQVGMSDTVVIRAIEVTIMEERGAEVVTN